MAKKIPFNEINKDHAPKKSDTFSKLWNFDTTPYDQRHSCFMPVGTDHGVGIKQPVGHKGNPTHNNKTIPLGVKRFEDY